MQDLRGHDNESGFHSPCSTDSKFIINIFQFY